LLADGQLRIYAIECESEAERKVFGGRVRGTVGPRGAFHYVGLDFVFCPARQNNHFTKKKKNASHQKKSATVKNKPFVM
jgi:hypothetical protein